MKKITNKYLAITIASVVLVGGVSFFAGMKYQQSKLKAFGRNVPGNGNVRMMNGGNASGGGARVGFKPVSGTVLSVNDTLMTVKLDDGSSKIVILSDKTVINKASVATKTDLIVGQTVAVFGSENSDGSVSAQNIQLNPVVREKSN